MFNDALRRRLNGEKDSRSNAGILSRGKNVYNGGTPQATKGPINPSSVNKQAILRRLGRGGR